VIVAKIEPSAEGEVAAIWTESDRTELPLLAGVLRRSLFRLDDLYVHLLETRDPGAVAIDAARAHPEFARISERLDSYISPYLDTWSSPADARAHCFYEWTPESR
jgi:cyclase